MPLSQFSIKLIESFKDKNCHEYAPKMILLLLALPRARRPSADTGATHSARIIINAEKHRLHTVQVFLRFIRLHYEYRRYKVYLHDME